MLKNHKNILYTLIAIIIIFFGYWYFVLSKKDTGSSSSNTLVPKTTAQDPSRPAQKAYDREFITSLQAIQYVDLDTSILQSEAYRALSFPEKPFQVDYNFPIGRRNPFLPIGIELQGPIPEVQTQNATTKATSTSTTTPPVVVIPKKR